MTAGIEAENGTDGLPRNLIPLKKVRLHYIPLSTISKAQTKGHKHLYNHHFY